MTGIRIILTIFYPQKIFRDLGPRIGQYHSTILRSAFLLTEDSPIPCTLKLHFELLLWNVIYRSPRTRSSLRGVHVCLSQQGDSSSLVTDSFNGTYVLCFIYCTTRGYLKSSPLSLSHSDSKTALTHKCCVACRSATLFLLLRFSIISTSLQLFSSPLPSCPPSSNSEYISSSPSPSQFKCLFTVKAAHVRTYLQSHLLMMTLPP